MAGIDPWTYADRSGTEHAAQTALFMWANMAERFGAIIADDPRAYTLKGWAVISADTHKHNGIDKPIPQLKWLHAIHNQGHGDAIRGAKAKAEGVKAGVADLFLPVPISRVDNLHGNNPLDYPLKACGLYLELKVGVNTPSLIQLEFMADMRAAGYAADWAVGWLEAREKILAYLQINC